MLMWLSANLGTIIISLVLAVMVVGIAVHLIRQKRQGKSSCGGDCASCHGGCSHKC